MYFVFNSGLEKVRWCIPSGKPEGSVQYHLGKYLQRVQEPKNL